MVIVFTNSYDDTAAAKDRATVAKWQKHLTNVVAILLRLTLEEQFDVTKIVTRMCVCSILKNFFSLRPNPGVVKLFNSNKTVQAICLTNYVHSSPYRKHAI